MKQYFYAGKNPANYEKSLHLFVKTENENYAAIQKKTSNWHEDNGYTEGPRDHSFSSRVFDFLAFGDFFWGGED